MKLNKIVCTLLLGMSVSTLSYAGQFVQIDEAALASLKSQVEQDKTSEAVKAVYTQVIKDADSLLDIKNPTVMDKEFFPPSKDKHDYLSLSRYWWPDETKDDGLPWVRKDGQTNPDTQTDKVDRPRIGVLTQGVYTLGVAYYLTGDEKYAEKGVSMIRTWFLDPDTKMNPNLEYAQSVPGYNEGRRSGILDGRLIPQKVLDSVMLFSKSKQWTEQDDTKMDAWLNEYLTWLTQSDLGKEGAKQTNNHGSWYKFQVLSLAWYLGKDDLVKSSIEGVEQNLATQFAEDGSQPHELERTRSYFYSTFNLEPLTRMAIIAQKAGHPIWNEKTEQGNSLKTGIDYLVPAVEGKPWKYQTPGLDFAYLLPLLARIEHYTGTQEYDAVIKKIVTEMKQRDNLNGDPKEIYQEIGLLYPSLLK